MSTTPLHDDHDSKLLASSAGLNDALIALGNRVGEDPDPLQSLSGWLDALCDASQASAIILWKRGEGTLRWQDSRGIELKDAAQNSRYTADIVSNVHSVCETGTADIFYCPESGTEQIPQAPSDEALIGDLVLRHRQIVIPITPRESQPVAALAIFQPSMLADGHRWTLEDASHLQSRLAAVLSAEKPQQMQTAPPLDRTDSGSLDNTVALRPANSQDSSERSLQKIDDSVAVYQADEGELQRRAFGVTQIVGRSLHEDQCAFDIANEVRNYLGTGRVSLAIFRGSSCQIKAVSGQQVFDARSATIASIQDLANQVAKVRQPVWHPDAADSLPRHLESKFQHYYESADSLSIALIPLLRRPDPSTDPNDLKAVVKDRDADPSELVGILIIEGLNCPLGETEILPSWQLIETPVVHAVANSRRHNGLFLMPLWKELGRFSDLFRGHRRNKAILITSLIVSVILALVIIPADFKLRSEGVIQPTDRSKVFAETDGVVKELLVADGQWVEKGDILLVLSNPALVADIAKIEGELRETRERLRTSRLQRMRKEFDSEQDRKTKVLESAGYAATLGKLQQQYDLLLEKQSQLTIHSPVSGQVVTWDTRRRLMARPVEPGQKLLTVADSKGPWELELKLPDKRSGYLRNFWNGDDADRTAPPKASYVLASHPSVVKTGVVRDVARSADVDVEGGNIIRVYVDLKDHPSDSGLRVRPGTEVIAHLHTGTASIGYCKLFEFFDWVRRIWFKYV